MHRITGNNRSNYNKDIIVSSGMIKINKQLKFSQVLAALSVSMGSMVVGFASAYTSPALVSMTNSNLTSFEISKQEVSISFLYSINLYFPMEFSPNKIDFYLLYIMTFLLSEILIILTCPVKDIHNHM